MHTLKYEMPCLVQRGAEVVPRTLVRMRNQVIAKKLEMSLIRLGKIFKIFGKEVTYSSAIVAIAR